MFSVNNISISFSGETIFSEVSFLVNPKERIGLTGKNGSGKSTLLKILSGILKPDTGEVVVPADKKVGYLPQEMQPANDRSVIQEALSAFNEIRALEDEIHRLSEQISQREDYESASYKKLLERHTEVNERFMMSGGYSMEGEAEKILSGLGFERNEQLKPLRTFSYGWQMRVEIAKLLLRHPDLLLLDEPTNHLDIESIQWLEEFLTNYHGAVILVSHDRAFLDNITNRTIEIELGRIYDYKTSYSGYIEQREQRLEKQLATFNNQQRQVRQIERFIERFRYKNTKAKQVQSRIRMLDKMEEIEIDHFDESGIRFRFPSAPESGKVVLEAENLTKYYDDKLVLSNLDFTILKNDRIAFVGKNGEGKTTLSKVIVGLTGYTGILKTGYNVKTGYFAQNQNETLDPEMTVFETIDHVARGEARTQVRSILGGFLFSDDDIDKKVKILSGGEKSRVALAKLLLEPANLLVLDEPTNHLDMRSKDILKNALLHYKGTLILVSHDRDFLQGLTNKVFEFKNRNIRQYIGDIYEFLEARKLRSLDQLEKRTLKEKVTDRPSDNKILYKKKKELDRDIRKISSNLEKIEDEIHRMEKEIRAMDQKMAAGDKDLAGSDFFRKYAQLKKELEEWMKKWERAGEELGQLEADRDQLPGKTTS